MAGEEDHNVQGGYCGLERNFNLDFIVHVRAYGREDVHRLGMLKRVHRELELLFGDRFEVEVLDEVLREQYEVDLATVPCMDSDEAVPGVPLTPFVGGS